MESDIGSVCRTNLEFMKWADEIMLAALLKVPSDRASADTGSSFKSMLDTLNHVYLAELVWFKHIQGEHKRLAELESPGDPAALAQAWTDMHKSWLDWAASMGREDWPGPFTYRNNAGGESTMPYWQIAMHVINHGSYHRGQFATMLRQAGIVPPATDLIIYYRSLAV
jgi:uncharacterized damage-inducible protein DinB